MLLRRSILFCILSAAMCQSAAAQGLEVTKSPASPTTEYQESGTAFDAPLVAFRLEAFGGNVDVDALTLTLESNTLFTDGVTGLGAWLDDGDGTFNDGLDQLLWSGPAGDSSVTAIFTAPVTVSSGTTEDIWIVASFNPDAGSSVGTSYQVSIKDNADISTVSGATTYVGVPLPKSTMLTLIDFYVSGVILNCYSKEVRIYGSGFTPPAQIYIDGVPAGGNVYVYPDHTQLVWEFGNANAPSGQDLQIRTATLGIRDTGRDWDSEECDDINPPGNDNGDDDDEEEFCSTHESPSPRPAVVLSILLVIAVVRQLRHNRTVSA